jgi:hypothetical protein
MLLYRLRSRILVLVIDKKPLWPGSTQRMLAVFHMQLSTAYKFLLRKSLGLSQHPRESTPKPQTALSVAQVQGMRVCNLAHAVT